LKKIEFGARKGDEGKLVLSPSGTIQEGSNIVCEKRKNPELSAGTQGRVSERGGPQFPAAFEKGGEGTKGNSKKFHKDAGVKFGKRGDFPPPAKSEGKK